MMRSLFSAVSGLKTHQTKMDVIGNNIANVNTVAFKSTATTFSEIMYQTVSNASGANATTGKGGVNARQIGLGVTTGSNKVSIASPGAAETTGDGFDIRLTDKVTTNFFIVNTGTQNLFTRAGSFYVDGAGNLAMTSTGYTVMGWQVDETTGEIKKDTVSALRIMQEKNLTSPPEATTKGTVAGTMDKNDPDVISKDGYMMNLTFYDKLGYSYTARLAVKVTDPDTESYTVELADILDANNVSVYDKYLADGGDETLVFGKTTTETKSYPIQSSDITYLATQGNITAAQGWAGAGHYYKYTTWNVATNTETVAYKKIDFDWANDSYTIPEITYTKNDGTPGTIKEKKGTISVDYGIPADQLQTPAASTSTAVPRSYIDNNGAYVYVGPAVNYELKFNKDDGVFSYVGAPGSSSVSLKMSALGENFSDIEIDFSSCQAADNGGKTTLGADRGIKNGSEGAGKALGAMIGISVNNDGRIYGSYDNGNTVLLGQIAVAQFANASGLEKVGENCYTTTLNSGDFDGIGVEIAADGSSMISGELEMSNVDLSTEFTQMIITQRGFQSNSRVITTSDTLLEELINLKR